MATRKSPRKITEITISGRRWFQRSYGNTYHSVQVWVNDEEVVNVPFAYGYDAGFIQTAIEQLKLKGYLADLDCIGEGALSMYCRDKGIKLHRNVCDVSRRRDL